MKIKIIAVALLSAAIAAPAFAANASAKTSTRKPAHATPSGHKPEHKMAGMKDGCEPEHQMGAHHGYGMMGGQGADMMMMETDMHMLGALDLSQDQKVAINKVSDDLKHNNWATQGMINDETAKLRDLYEAGKRDVSAIGKEYQKIFDLKRQMIETYLDAQNRIEEILTADQLAEIKGARTMMHHMTEHRHMQ